jgi:hypothetical protein
VHRPSSERTSRAAAQAVANTRTYTTAKTDEAVTGGNLKLPLGRFVSNSANTPSITRKRLPDGVTCIDRLLRGFERGTSDLHLSHDLLKVADSAATPVRCRRAENRAPRVTPPGLPLSCRYAFSAGITSQAARAGWSVGWTSQIGRPDSPIDHNSQDYRQMAS